MSSVGLVVMIPILMNTTSASFYAILVILLPIIALFLIIVYVSIKKIIKVSSIDKYNYYVMLDIYEMKFSGSKKKASTTFDQYTCSKIGDTFYIVTFGKYRFAYNKKIF